MRASGGRKLQVRAMARGSRPKLHARYVHGTEAMSEVASEREKHAGYVSFKVSHSEYSRKQMELLHGRDQKHDGLSSRASGPVGKQS